MSDASHEVVLERGERARQEVRVIGANAACQLARDRPRGLIAGGDPRLECRAGSVGSLAAMLPMRCAGVVLAPRAGKAFLELPDDPRRPVADHSGSPAPSRGPPRSTPSSQAEPCVCPGRYPGGRHSLALRRSRLFRQASPDLSPAEGNWRHSLTALCHDSSVRGRVDRLRPGEAQFPGSSVIAL
jgi:hypothetical protein